MIHFTSDDRKYARGSSKFCASGGGVDYDRDLCMVVVEGRGDPDSKLTLGQYWANVISYIGPMLANDVGPM